MKKLLVIMLALAMIFAFAACAAEEPAPAEAPAETPAEAPAETEMDDLAYVQDKGNLIIGITLFEPMNYYDANGKLVGFETEFAEAICAKLGLTPDFLEINWDTKEIELASKTIDCIWNGLTVTEERRANMLFSDSYIKNMQVIVVRAANADQFTDAASLAAASLVAEIKSAGETAIAADPDLSQAAYTAVDKQASALLEVKAGTADAAVIDYVMAAAMVGEGTDYSDLMIVPGVELAVEEYAIGFRLESPLAAAVNEAMAEMVEDGSLAAIAEKYDLTNQLIFNQ